jgi:hypothetical protein
MDEVLARRYMALFEAYGIGGPPALGAVKSFLSGVVEKQPHLLRPDAAHFLLVNSDHMAIRPLAGDVPLHRGEPTTPPMSQDEVRERLLGSLSTLLFNAAQKEPHPLSAHAILRALENTRAELGESLGWA